MLLLGNNQKCTYQPLQGQQHDHSCQVSQADHLDLFGKHECQFRERKTSKEERHTFHSGCNYIGRIVPFECDVQNTRKLVEGDCTAAEDSIGCKTAEEAIGCMTAEDSMGSTAAEDLTEESSEVVPFEIS